jgi:Domain of unknown function (DUF1707)/Domain of unknown function (DUF4190)
MAFELERADLRCADADRDDCVERLRAAAMEGRLDHEELEERLAAAYAAKTCGDLTRLVADVTPPAAVPPSAPPLFVRPARRMNGLAVASLLLSLFWFGFIGSVAGVILGHTALRQINASGGAQGGRAIAITGLLVGYFWIGIAVLMLALAVVL